VNKETVTLRVRKERALTLAADNCSMLYVAGDELPRRRGEAAHRSGLVERA
jgi:hypothetical protein